MMISLSRVYRYKKEIQGSTPEKPLFTEEFKSYQDPGISIQPFSTKPPAPASQSYMRDANSLSELNPFMDTWRKATFSKNNLTIYLYSAFYDNRDPNNVLIRINVAAPTKFRGVSYYNIIRIYLVIRTDNIFCFQVFNRLRCLIATNKGNIVSTTVQVIIQKEHFSLPWSSFFVMCQLTDKRSQYVPKKSILTENEVNAVSITDDIKQGIAKKQWKLGIFSVTF